MYRLFIKSYTDVHFESFMYIRWLEQELIRNLSASNLFSKGVQD
jgi:hypothetical protein